MRVMAKRIGAELRKVIVGEELHKVIGGGFPLFKSVASVVDAREESVKCGFSSVWPGSRAGAGLESEVGPLAGITFVQEFPYSLVIDNMSYCRLVVLDSADKSYIHHFCAIDPSKGRLEDNIAEFKSSLLEFVTKEEMEGVRLKILTSDNYSSNELGVMACNSFEYKVINQGVLEEVLEELGKEIGERISFDVQNTFFPTIEIGRSSKVGETELFSKVLTRGSILGECREVSL